MKILIFVLLFTAGCASMPSVPTTWKCHTDLECMEECLAHGLTDCENWHVGE